MYSVAVSLYGAVCVTVCSADSPVCLSTADYITEFTEATNVIH